MKQLLHHDWFLRHHAGDAPAAIRERVLPAAVPGCVHSDLLAAGVIPDPYLDRNEAAVQWVGGCDWRYRLAFEADPDLLACDRIDLVCEGLDTVAEIALNGEEVARTFNMHREYRFDVKALLRGDNALSIIFRSALRHAEGVRDALGDLPNAYPTPFNFVRKMACSFGWDWGPTLITAGIWQPLRLEGWSVARIASFRPLVTLDDHGAEIEIRVDLEWDDPAGEILELEAQLLPPEISGSRPDSIGTASALLEIEAQQRQALLRLRVDDPLLWWPRGYGDQPLYDLELILTAGIGAAARTLDRRAVRLGLRSVRLDTDPDDHGAAFTFEINGRSVFVKGANWIPDDALVTRVDRGRYRERIEQAAAANMNMLRVWGGGIYEQDAFYEICDEIGMLVWQDFLFACAAYPEEEPQRSEVEAEARHQVARLITHPSLVLWNGNNENLWGYEDWGWQEQIGERTWGAGYYHDLLPRVVAEIDPTRPYWPGSPWSAPGVHPNADGYGPRHIWDAWNDCDYTVYRDYQPRFVSEFGHQAPATYATLRAAVSDRVLDHTSANLLHHQKAFDGHAKLERRLLEHFPPPRDFDAWLATTQLNQARAVRVGVGHFRSLQPLCMGTLYWQLNDDWPVVSWSAIDSGGRRKPLWYATRRFYADRFLTLQPRPAGLTLFALNDHDEPWRATLTVERRAFDGTLLAETHFEPTIAARNKTELLLPAEIALPADDRRELIRAFDAERSDWWFFRPDKELAYPAPLFDSTLERSGRLHRFRITAHTLLRDLVLYADAVAPDAEVNDQLITLLPGEVFTFEIDSAEVLGEAALRERLQSANLYGARLSS